MACVGEGETGLIEGVDAIAAPVVVGDQAELLGGDGFDQAGDVGAIAPGVAEALGEGFEVGFVVILEGEGDGLAFATHKCTGTL